MSNYSYLCTSDLETTYPSFVDKQYNPDQQTIACDVECVPLVWLALFRPADLINKTYMVEGRQVATTAPLCELATALKHLDEALPYFNAVFSEEGALDEFFALLRKGVAAGDAKYVTIEMQEIACLYSSEQDFYGKFLVALTNIQTKSEHDAKDLFTKLANMRRGRKFPPARLILDRIKAEDHDIWNHCRILGTSSSRPVPWEGEESIEVATRSEAVQPKEDKSLAIAARNGDLDEVKKLLAEGADPRVGDSLDEPALVCACHLGKNALAVVQALVEAGADVNKGGTRSPLEAALMRGSLDVAEYLVKRGADVNVQLLEYTSHTDKSKRMIKRRQSLLEYARKCNRPRMADFLLLHGAIDKKADDSK
jgi:hypothetical protein